MGMPYLKITISHVTMHIKVTNPPNPNKINQFTDNNELNS